MTEEYKECKSPGSAYAEWCREWCPNYGKGICHYDWETKKMMVRIDEE